MWVAEGVSVSMCSRDYTCIHADAFRVWGSVGLPLNTGSLSFKIAYKESKSPQAQALFGELEIISLRNKFGVSCSTPKHNFVVLFSCRPQHHHPK